MVQRFCWAHVVPPPGVAVHFMSLREAERLHPLLAGSLLAEAAPATRRSLETHGKMHGANWRWLLNGADGRDGVWETEGCRSSAPPGGADDGDGPCFAVVCGSSCDWKSELFGLQRVYSLTDKRVYLENHDWTIVGEEPCCRSAPRCKCNGVPRLQLRDNRNRRRTVARLLPLVRAALSAADQEEE
jgi:hypothetical protein